MVIIFGKSGHKVGLFVALLLTIIAAGTTAQNAGSLEPTRESLSRGFGKFKIGMPYQDAYEAIKGHPGMDYDGLPDVSLNPGKDERIIETRGGSFIRRGVFQFREEKLFSIILELNPDMIDYYSLFTDFTRRYGDPASLSPSDSRWEDQELRIILEKPLVVKYLDVKVIDQILQQASIRKSLEEETRDVFIKTL